LHGSPALNDSLTRERSGEYDIYKPATKLNLTGLGAVNGLQGRGRFISEDNT